MTKTTATWTPTANDVLVMAVANAESVATALHDADLAAHVYGINMQGLGVAGRTPHVVVQARDGASTLRVAQVLFGTPWPPLQDPHHHTLVTYRGETPDHGVVQVFGGRH